MSKQCFYWESRDLKTLFIFNRLSFGVLKTKTENGLRTETSLEKKLAYVTYINPTKEVKGVCVREGGFLSGLPVLCDERHGVHGQLG